MQNFLVIAWPHGRQHNRITSRSSFMFSTSVIRWPTRAQARRDGPVPSTPAATSTPAPAGGNQSVGGGGGGGTGPSSAEVGMYVAIVAAGTSVILALVSCFLYQLGYLVRKPLGIHSFLHVHPFKKEKKRHLERATKRPGLALLRPAIKFGCLHSRPSPALHAPAAPRPSRVARFLSSAGRTARPPPSSRPSPRTLRRRGHADRRHGPYPRPPIAASQRPPRPFLLSPPFVHTSPAPLPYALDPQHTPSPPYTPTKQRRT